MNVLIVLTGFINICDIGPYSAWGTRINHKAISYLAYPKEAAASAWSLQYLLVLVVFIIQCIVFIRIYKKYFSDKILVHASLIRKFSFIVLFPVIAIIGIRGGLQSFPLDKS